MSEWQEYKFSDFVEILKNTYKPNSGFDLPYIGLEHINEQSLSLNSVGKSSEVISNKFYFEKGDILFGKLRPYFRKVLKINFKGVCSTDIWVLRSKGKCDQVFLFYFCANPIFISRTSNACVGTKMPRADWNYIKETIWKIPTQYEQRRIAAVLSILDDKIDLLRCQNETLEKMAQALFKRWFVDFNFPDEAGKPYKSSGGKMQSSELGEIPQGWRITKLREAISAIKGLSYKGDGLADSGTPMHNLKSIYEGGGYQHTGIKHYTGEFKERHICSAGDIIVTNTEQGERYKLIGFPARIPSYFKNVSIFTHHLFKINVLKNAYLSNEYIYYLLMSNLIRNQIVGYTNGTTVNMLSPDGLKMPIFPLPEKTIITKFSNIINPIWYKMENNINERIFLTKIRDGVLPKLMSGKIRVTE
ncbi:MAG: restriction endonuclease subunit S [Candidatus Aminicenantes bacterium]|nr:restriction endonuclease subunit S [Candidatus Aminicenantes bacterium]